MNINEYFHNIKRKFQIVIILINLISFLMMSFYINKKDLNYIEYTNLPKLLSNCYILIILLIMLIHSIYPKIVFFLIKDNFSILTNDKGKVIIILFIGILFWTSNNKVHTLFCIVTFISFFILLLCEFICDCKFVHKMEGDLNNNDENEKKNTEQNNISKSNNFNNALIMNQQIIQKQKKNESNVPFFENIQENYFENIKQVNLKAESSKK